MVQFSYIALSRETFPVIQSALVLEAIVFLLFFLFFLIISILHIYTMIMPSVARYSMHPYNGN